jgi:Straboviridae/Kyanoviridae head completion nuclease
LSNKSAWNNKYKQGLYNATNPDKYIGNPLDIKFRSSWEYAFCKYLDLNEKILKWACEQPIITYSDLRNKVHRYYPDFYYEIMVNGDSMNYERVIVEVKPASELFPPEQPKNESAKALENFEYSVRTHIKNKLKWNAAEEYARRNKMKFVIITEHKLREQGILPS